MVPHWHGLDCLTAHPDTGCTDHERHLADVMIDGGDFIRAEPGREDTGAEVPSYPSGSA